MEKQLTPIAEAMRLLESASDVHDGHDCTFRFVEIGEIKTIIESLIPKEKEVIIKSHFEGQKVGSQELVAKGKGTQYFNDNFKQK